MPTPLPSFPALLLDGPAEGLIGNGRSVVIATPSDWRFHHTKETGAFSLTLDGAIIPLESLAWKTESFPGGIVFTHETTPARIELFHTALPDDDYGVLVRLTGDYARATFIATGAPSLLARTAANRDEQGRLLAGFSVSGKIANASLDTLRAAVLAPYVSDGMILHSPDGILDLAVLFNQHLLDLSYNGDLIVCELFRWADIWSRDLGSGFVPGALFTNRLEAARKCIEVDLARHETATARALKTTADTSQGGSAEGVSWLTCALWDYYLITGDRVWLRRVAEGLRPWVDAWLARDHAGLGLVADTTDWMDHSRYLLLSLGGRSLYANSLMVRLLDTFALIETELADAPAAARYRTHRDRFIDGINRHLWSDRLGAYAHLHAGGRVDERTASADNALALLASVATPERAARVLATLREKNGRPSGTLTITPLMTLVPDNDQNEKIWPWWVAYEALARFRHGDADEALRLLHACADTIRNARYPGMMDEIMDRDGVSEGGRAFATAAGSLLTAIHRGLFGIDILKAGMAEVKITPSLPSGWTDCALRQPTPGGHIDIRVVNRALRIDVHAPRIQVIHTTEDAVVTGARKTVWHPPAPAQDRTAPAPTITAPPLRPRTPAVWCEPGFPHADVPGISPDWPRLDWAALAALDISAYDALVIPGNALPFFTPTGERLQPVLDRFLARGGLLFFHGAEMAVRTLGGPRNYDIYLGREAGVVIWYSHTETGWSPVHPRTGAPVERPLRDGVTYWGEGPYFGGWDSAYGAFGFRAETFATGAGLRVPATSPLAGKISAAPNAAIRDVFTDFAVSAPWFFQPLATTRTALHDMIPADGEEFACAVRLVNRTTGGEVILTGRDAAAHVPPSAILGDAS